MFFGWTIFIGDTPVSEENSGGGVDGGIKEKWRGEFGKRGGKTLVGL